jgi:hypothetical protein
MPDLLVRADRCLDTLEGLVLGQELQISRMLLSGEDACEAGAAILTDAIGTVRDLLTVVREVRPARKVAALKNVNRSWQPCPAIGIMGGNSYLRRS